MQKYRIDAPTVLWNLTNECNLHCSYCYQNAGKNNGNELPLEKKLALVDEFIDGGVISIGFSGGEALLREKELCEIAKYAGSKGLFISVITNGTLLTKDRVKRLKEHGVQKIHINLDSQDKRVHDSYRQKEGCWDKALEGLLNSKESGLQTEIIATITKRNFSQVEKFIQFGRYLGVEIEITTLIPTGRGKNIADQCLNSEQMENVLENVARYSFDGPAIRMSTNPEFVPYLRKYVKKEGKKELLNHPSLDCEIGCMAGVGWCAVQPDGLVTPCVLTPNLVAGDLKKQNFVDIWQNSPLFEKLRDRDNLKGNCGDCEDKYDCGGCRGRAYALTHDPLEGDLRCVVHKQRKNRS